MSIRGGAHRIKDVGNAVHDNDVLNAGGINTIEIVDLSHGETQAISINADQISDACVKGRTRINTDQPSKIRTRVTNHQPIREGGGRSHLPEGLGVDDQGTVGAGETLNRG